MRRAKKNSTRFGFLALICTTALLMATATSAYAAQGWRLDSLADSSVAPGGTFEYLVQATNTSATATDGSEIDLTGTLPAGLTIASATLYVDPKDDNIIQPVTGECYAGDGVSPVVGQGDFKCTSTTAVPSTFYQLLRLTVTADPAASGTLTASFAVSGGGLSAATTVDPTRIESGTPRFGIDAVDGQPSDLNGNLVTQAGAHPALDSLSLDFNTYTNPVPLAGTAWPVQPVRDVNVDLPPGLVGDPAGVPTCSATQLLGRGKINSETRCPPSSQVGTVLVRTNNTPLSQPIFGPFPVFNLEPPADAPARLGFNVGGTMVILDASVRSGSDYGVTLHSREISEAIPIAGTTFTLWGAPADSAHTPERACYDSSPPGLAGPSCPSGDASTAFIRSPTSCTAPGVGLLTVVSADSWFSPGVFSTASFRTHQPPAYPAAPADRGPERGTSGCDRVPFDPTLEGQPVEHTPNTPSGFAFDLSLPQSNDPGQIAEADLKKAVVTLPAGVRVNPSAADGLQACTSAQVHLHDEQSPSCPDAAKIGSVTVKTPLLKDPLKGAVYLAAPHDNPFGTLLSIYLVAEGSGVVIKLAGRVDADPATGQLTATFDDNPQLPFEDLHLSFDGGPRAQLVTPPHCGTYTTHGVFSGWNGAVSTSDSSFTIDQGCVAPGFDPALAAGARSSIAGATSPFSLRITRSDSEQELSGLTVKLPPGLSGYLKGIPYCPDAALDAVSGDEGTGAAQASTPSCPAASLVGTSTVGAGAGSNPIYVQTGRAYLAGPYRGAPLSLAIVTPAVAGPFDLGNVVVRSALRVDPETARITAVSDPLPTILHGIPLQLRDVRVSLDREHFTLNPTDCDPLQIGSVVTSTEGATATPSQRFQVGDCGSLGFGPSLALRLSGPTRRGGNPALRATLRMPAGDQANVAKVQVSLPRSEFVAQDHLADVCTRVQYAADGGGGAGCPARSVYGHARAWSPLLDRPLEGPVYLRSNGGDRPLPDLVASLDGQVHIDAVGYVGSNKKTGGLRTTFATVPDAPVGKIVLTMPAGKHSLLENSTNICSGNHPAIIRMRAHDDALAAAKTPLQVKCGKQRGGRRG